MSLGFGYVVFEEISSAKLALREHKIKINGCTIICKSYKKKLDAEKNLQNSSKMELNKDEFTPKLPKIEKAKIIGQPLENKPRVDFSVFTKYSEKIREIVSTIPEQVNQ